MSAGRSVAECAEKYVGVRENPMGSNLGRPYPEAWQKPWGMGVGWPWCAAFADAMYKEAGVDDDGIGNPGTAVMYERAKARGAIVSRPMPGAYILWPGVHVGIVVRDLGGGVCLTVEGNAADGVNYRRREYAGAVLVAPRAVRDGFTGEVAERDYYLEDPAARPRIVGPWSTREARERALAKVTDFIRRFRKDGKYYAEIGSPRVYGPWDTKAQRDRARVVLQDRLGRLLRPFSRPAAGAPVSADTLGKTT